MTYKGYAEMVHRLATLRFPKIFSIFTLNKTLKLKSFTLSPGYVTKLKTEKLGTGTFPDFPLQKNLISLSTSTLEKTIRSLYYIACYKGILNSID